MPTSGQELVTQGSMFLVSICQYKVLTVYSCLVQLRVLRGGREEDNTVMESKCKRKRSSISHANVSD